jgi:hypothetical protein
MTFHQLKEIDETCHRADETGMEHALTRIRL